MSPTLERLIALRADPATLAQIEYVDLLSTAAVVWCARPGDWERVAGVVHELVDELTTTRAANPQETHA